MSFLLFVLVYFLVPSFSILVHAYGLNGKGPSALELYRTIPREMINDQTRVCILNACSHSGLLAEARSVFDDIVNPHPMIATAIVCDSSTPLFLLFDTLFLLLF